ncbi:MAG TPA: RluA family pseudouridine synthase [Lentimicrobium sp.]|nr:RluA family pseudouridine synthase [Lentimicrobium sp.]
MEPAYNPPVPKKHQPKGLTILYEDRDILVADKSHGLLTIGCEREKERTAHFILNDYVKKGNERSKNRVFIVHRLDRETSGVIIFAKNQETKFFLQDNWNEFTKKYVAVVHGRFQEKSGVITSYLMENKAFKVYSTNDTVNGKYAKTGYNVLKENVDYSLLEINLFTGRKHQIRVHLSERGHPVAGDKLYGSPEKCAKRLALHCSSLTIIHPFTKKEMCFETGIPGQFLHLYKLHIS